MNGVYPGCIRTTSPPLTRERNNRCTRYQVEIYGLQVSKVYTTSSVQLSRLHNLAQCIALSLQDHQSVEYMCHKRWDGRCFVVAREGIRSRRRQLAALHDEHRFVNKPTGVPGIRITVTYQVYYKK